MTIKSHSIYDLSRETLRDVNKPRKMLQYGFPGLSYDLCTQSGHLVVIGAKTGCGKSLLALQMARAMASAGVKTAYLSLEMSNRLIAERNLASAGTMAAIKHGDAVEAQLAAMRALVESQRAMPLEIAEAYGATVKDIADFISSNKDVKVVIVDYLQLLGGAQASQYERTTDASKALATLAHETGVTIIGLAQLAIKGDAGQGDPTLASIQATSQYSQDADAVLLMYRESDQDADSRRVLQIAKNRHGPAGRKLFLDFDGNRMLLTESADQTRRKPEKPAKIDFSIPDPCSKAERAEMAKIRW